MHRSAWKPTLRLLAQPVDPFLCAAQGIRPLNGWLYRVTRRIASGTESAWKDQGFGKGEMQASVFRRRSGDSPRTLSITKLLMTRRTRTFVFKRLALLDAICLSRMFLPGAAACQVYGCSTIQDDEQVEQERAGEVTR